MKPFNVKVLALLLVSQFLWFSTPVTGLATEHYVAPGGNCGVVAPCYSTIQAAVDAASMGDTIKVAEGRYTAAGLQVVSLNKGLTVAGGYTSTDWNSADPTSHPTIVDAENVLGRRPFYIHNTDTLTATVRGFIIENGYQEGFQTNGAGIYVQNGRVLIADNLIQNNRQGGTQITYGGGLYINAGTVTVHDNLFRHNESLSRGGGLYIGEEATATILDNIFENNQSFIGGGLFVKSGVASTIMGNEVRRNQAERGGGFYVEFGSGGPIEIAYNLIENNQATASGGLELSSLFNVHIHHNRIRHNQAATFGGGLSEFFGEVSVIIEHNTIEGNQAGTDGGGAYIQVSQSSLRHNTIHDNTAVRDGGALYYGQALGSLQSNLISHNTAHGRGGAIAIFRLPQVTDPTRLIAENDIIANNNSPWEAVYVVDQQVQASHWTVADNGSYALTASGNSTVTLANTIIAGHDIAGLNGAVTADHTLFHDNASQCTGGALCTNSLMGDPRFVNPLQGNYHLNSGSAAFNTGINAGVFADVDGEIRPLCGGFDVGADEYSGPSIAPMPFMTQAITDTTTLTATLTWNIPGAQNISLRYADALITDDNWDTAAILSDTLPGETMTYTAVIPYTGGSVYFALRYGDGCGESAVSPNAFWPQWLHYLPVMVK